VISIWKNLSWPCSNCFPPLIDAQFVTICLGLTSPGDIEVLLIPTFYSCVSGYRNVTAVFALSLRTILARSLTHSKLHFQFVRAFNFRRSGHWYHFQVGQAKVPWLSALIMKRKEVLVLETRTRTLAQGISNLKLKKYIYLADSNLNKQTNG